MPNDRETIIKMIRLNAEGLYDDFVRHSRGARSRCQCCGQSIYLEINATGLVDWRTADNQYLCESGDPVTEDSINGHEPVKGV